MTTAEELKRLRMTDKQRKREEELDALAERNARDTAKLQAFYDAMRLCQPEKLPLN